jgi:hypothetical protein
LDALGYASDTLGQVEFVRAVLGFVPRADQADVSKLFTELDRDETGGLAYSELRQGLRTMMLRRSIAGRLAVTQAAGAATSSGGGGDDGDGGGGGGTADDGIPSSKKREMMALYTSFQAQLQASTPAMAILTNSPPKTAAYVAPRVESFGEFVRLYYPKATKDEVLQWPLMVIDGLLWPLRATDGLSEVSDGL